MAREESNAGVRVETTRNQLRELRKKLLDLTNRNRFLNFKHSDASRKQLRLINDSLEHVYSLIRKDEKISVRPLPEAPGVPVPPPDGSYARELSLETNSLTQDILTADQLGAFREKEAAKARAAQAQERLRTALRAAANAHHINPSFALPVGSSEVNTGKYLQVLHFQEALERKLSGLRDDFRSILQELGINTLYCAIGFLEWYEAESSEQPLLSPLLLHPIALDRTLDRGRYQYKIIGTSEDTETNVTLSERLTSDFGIKLPTFEPGDEPNPIVAYFEKIEKLIEDKPRWKIRPYATLAIFNFSRLAMYKDLDPAVRSEAAALHNHSIVRDLLGGIDEDKGLSSEVYEVDEPNFLRAVPLLIKDADPSQFSAIVDVMRGHSIVISGPPGTGKSQTITNLIAGAMAAGKTVLFLAEKLAALQVVKSRLDAAGLGVFCLELHSTRSRKAEVLDSVRRRMTARAEARSNLSAELARLEHYKQELRSYIDALNTPFGGRARTVHELIWAAQAAEIALPEELRLRLRDLDIPGAHNYDDAAFESLIRAADAFSATSSQISQEFGSPSGHPWRGVNGQSVNAEAARRLLRYLREAASALSSLTVVADDMGRAVHYEGEISLHALTELAGLRENLGDSRFRFPEQIVTSLCLEPYRSAVATLITDLSNFKRSSLEWSQRYSKFGMSDWSLVGAEEASLSAVNDCLERYPDSETVGSLGELKHTLALNTKLFTMGAALLARINEKLSIADANAEVCYSVLRAVDLLWNTDWAALSSRSPDLVARNQMPLLLQAKAKANDLRATRSALRERFVLDDTISMRDILECEKQFRVSNAFSFLSGDYRKAKKLYRSISRDFRKETASESASACHQLASFLEELSSFDADAKLRRISGDLWNGVDSDFQTMITVSQYATEIHRLFRSCGTEAAGLAAHFTTCNDRELDWLRGVGSDPAVRAILDFPNMRSQCAELSELASRTAARHGDIDALIQTLTRLSVLESMPLLDLSRSIVMARSLEQLAERISRNESASAALGTVFKSLETDLALVESLLDIAHNIMSLSVETGLRDAFVASRAEERNALAPALDSARAHLRVFCESLSSAADEGLQESEFFRNQTWTDETTMSLFRRVDLALRHADSAAAWFRYQQTRETLLTMLRDPALLLLLESNPEMHATSAVTSVFCASVVRAAFVERAVLERYNGDDLTDTRTRFSDLDLRLLGMHAKQLRAELLSRFVDPGNRIGPKSTFTGKSLLMNEAGKQKRYIAIRDLTRRAGKALQDLKPCFMMSPLSVAQFLSPGSVNFDLIIIDEASQMRPEDAIGALSRGNQVAIVGDPKQLPPTSFFDRIDQSEDESDEDADDSESILDLSMKQYYPARSLMWHYRSRHESLIAFSNHHFYNNELIVFPSPHGRSEAQGVTLKYVGGNYRSSVNVAEARAVASAALEFMRTRPSLSLGIVAMNQPQRDYILAEVERLMAGDPVAADYEARWSQRLEPFFVKNLETVQGDERDVILISTVYGPDERQLVMQRFGPINARNGWRRLNVLFTRAKHSVQVFTSLRATDIVVDAQTSRGARAFRDYLEYAESGRLDGGVESGREPGSDFEVAVADALRNRGYEVTAQVGVAGYFIDMAVRYPHSSGHVVGIECDGATYHRAKSARDRDRIREERLNNLGWKLHRIWSTDWFANPRREIEKLVARIELEISKRDTVTNPQETVVRVNGEGGEDECDGAERNAIVSVANDDAYESSDEGAVRGLEFVRGKSENNYTLVQRLEARGLLFVDQRHKPHGNLWVVGDESLASFFSELEAEGIKFRYASGGGRATNFCPGWFTINQS